MFPVRVRTLLSAILLLLVNLMFSGQSVVATAKSLEGIEWHKIVDKHYGRGIGWTKFVEVSRKLVGSSLKEIEQSLGKPLKNFDAIPGELPPLGEHVFYKIAQEPVKDDPNEVQIYFLALTVSGNMIHSYTVYSGKAVNSPKKVNVDDHGEKGIGWTKFSNVSKKLVGSSLEEIEKSLDKPLPFFKALPGEVPPLGEHVFYKVAEEPAKEDPDEVRTYLLALTVSGKKIRSYTVFSCTTVTMRSLPGS